MIIPVRRISHLLRTRAARFLGLSQDPSTQAGKGTRIGLLISGAFLVSVGLLIVLISSLFVVLAFPLFLFGGFNLLNSRRKQLSLSRSNLLSLSGHLCATVVLYLLFTRVLWVTYITDSIVGSYMGVLKVLAFQNPYGYSIKPFLDQFSFSPSFYTPRVDGSFEFHLNYPALNFLSLLPLYAVGLHDLRDGVFVFHIVSVLVIFGLVLSRIRRVKLDRQRLGVLPPCGHRPLVSKPEHGPLDGRAGRRYQTNRSRRSPISHHSPLAGIPQLQAEKYYCWHRRDSDRVYRPQHSLHPLLTVSVVGGDNCPLPPRRRSGDPRGNRALRDSPTRGDIASASLLRRPDGTGGHRLAISLRNAILQIKILCLDLPHHDLVLLLPIISKLHLLLVASTGPGILQKQARCIALALFAVHRHCLARDNSCWFALAAREAKSSSPCKLAAYDDIRRCLWSLRFQLTALQGRCPDKLSNRSRRNRRCDTSEPNT